MEQSEAVGAPHSSLVASAASTEDDHLSLHAAAAKDDLASKTSTTPVTTRRKVVVVASGAVANDDTPEESSTLRRRSDRVPRTSYAEALSDYEAETDEDDSHKNKRKLERRKKSLIAKDSSQQKKKSRVTPNKVERDSLTRLSNRKSPFSSSKQKSYVVFDDTTVNDNVLMDSLKEAPVAGGTTSRILEISGSTAPWESKTERIGSDGADGVSSKESVLAPYVEEGVPVTHMANIPKLEMNGMPKVKESVMEERTPRASQTFNEVLGHTSSQVLEMSVGTASTISMVLGSARQTHVAPNKTTTSMSTHAPYIGTEEVIPETAVIVAKPTETLVENGVVQEGDGIPHKEPTSMPKLAVYVEEAIPRIPVGASKIQLVELPEMGEESVTEETRRMPSVLDLSERELLKTGAVGDMAGNGPNDLEKTLLVGPTAFNDEQAELDDSVSLFQDPDLPEKEFLQSGATGEIDGNGACASNLTSLVVPEAAGTEKAESDNSVSPTLEPDVSEKELLQSGTSGYSYRAGIPKEASLLGPEVVATENSEFLDDHGTGMQSQEEFVDPVDSPTTVTALEARMGQEAAAIPAADTFAADKRGPTIVSTRRSSRLSKNESKVTLAEQTRTSTEGVPQNGTKITSVDQTHTLPEQVLNIGTKVAWVEQMHTGTERVPKNETKIVSVNHRHTRSEALPDSGTKVSSDRQTSTRSEKGPYGTRIRSVGQTHTLSGQGSNGTKVTSIEQTHTHLEVTKNGTKISSVEQTQNRLEQGKIVEDSYATQSNSETSSRKRRSMMPRVPKLRNKKSRVLEIEHQDVHIGSPVTISALGADESTPELDYNRSPDELGIEQGENVAEPTTRDDGLVDCISELGGNDVIVGKHNEAASHLGNAAYHASIVSTRDKWNSETSQDGKKLIVNEVLQQYRFWRKKGLRWTASGNKIRDIGKIRWDLDKSPRRRSAKGKGGDSRCVRLGYGLTEADISVRLESEDKPVAEGEGEVGSAVTTSNNELQLGSSIPLEALEKGYVILGNNRGRFEWCENDKFYELRGSLVNQHMGASQDERRDIVAKIAGQFRFARRDDNGNFFRAHQDDISKCIVKFFQDKGCKMRQKSNTKSAQLVNRGKSVTQITRIEGSQSVEERENKHTRFGPRTRILETEYHQVKPESEEKRKERYPAPRISDTEEPQIVAELQEEGLRLVAESEYHVEELAEFYNASEPLKPAEPLPELPPEDSGVKWTFGHESRVLYADFRKKETLSKDDKAFLAKMMQRDDITVISQGLIGKLDLSLWSYDFIEKAVGHRHHHKLRRFERSESDKSMFIEMPAEERMEISEFIRYLRKRQELFEDREGGLDPHIDIRKTSGDTENVNVLNVAFYLIDLDIPQLLPALHNDFCGNFKVKEMLPAGAWCMLGEVPAQSRPFMGPNLYISPGGGFTQLHQDGHGTVDSGHFNVAGYSEVVMLRRLPESHKENACKIFRGETTGSSDPMYGLPHDIFKGHGPLWPSHETIEDWKKLNYYPSVFILQPGEHVHINKGRLHAFRKFTRDELPPQDCHRFLREALIKEKGISADPDCVSIAFDWQFKGIDAEGINRELSSTIECAARCRLKNRSSLAIPGNTLLHLAKSLGRKRASLETSMLGFESLEVVASGHTAHDIDVYRGILPSLKFLVERNLSETKNFPRKKRLPDSDQDPLSYSIDPYGSDYFCKICMQELSNSYFHCDGCETLLAKDFNICAECFGEKRYHKYVRMHTKSAKKTSDMNHIGMKDQRRGRGCSCHQGICADCKYCKCCSCRCHTKFSVHDRHFGAEELKSILKECEEEVGTNEVEYAKVTLQRLRKIIS